MNVSGLAVSRNNMQTIVSVTSFVIVAYQVSRNIIWAPRSVIINDVFTLYSQSDCSINFERGNENRVRKSRRTLQIKVRIKSFLEQLTLFVKTFVLFKKLIIQ